MSFSLWIDPSFGASGNMLLGAFSELVENPYQALEPLDGLNLGKWDIELKKTLRCSLTATEAQVRYDEATHGRQWSEIDLLLSEADLPINTANGARETFRLLGQAEAKQHGVDINQVHFHEVGAVDAIIDVVGVWLLLSALEEDHGMLNEITIGPVGLGYGSVEASHGTLPLPAPATVEILQGCPVTNVNIDEETCTPTGAALLVSLATRWGGINAGQIGSSSRGAGTRNPASYPNVVSIILLNQSEATTTSQPKFLLETNVDDVTPEVIAHTIESLLTAGAEDAWIVPIIMKKGRPGQEIRILCSDEKVETLKALLFSATGSLGCRIIPVEKTELPRSLEQIHMYGEMVSIKVGPYSAKPEHNDLVRVANKTQLPLRQLAEEATLIWAQKEQA